MWLPCFFGAGGYREARQEAWALLRMGATPLSSVCPSLEVPGPLLLGGGHFTLGNTPGCTEGTRIELRGGELSPLKVRAVGGGV